MRWLRGGQRRRGQLGVIVPRSKFVVLALFCAGLVLGPGAVPAMSASSTKYVDCLVGSDDRDGSSLTSAWKTLTRANKATLRPGDSLLLARGCAWSGQRIDAGWVGTRDAPITIGAYGTGASPRITGGLNQNVKITGAWQIIQDIDVVGVASSTSSCGQTFGEHYGFNLQPGAHDNTVQRSSATAELAGVHIAGGAVRNHILHNDLIGNSMLKSFSTNPEADQGAWGLLLNGDDNEIAYNAFSGNTAACANGQLPLAQQVDQHLRGAGQLDPPQREPRPRVLRARQLGPPPDDGHPLRLQRLLHPHGRVPLRHDARRR